MKQYTITEQTSKLIDLGFEPSNRITRVVSENGKVHIFQEQSFSIGELIDILPKELSYNDGDWGLSIERNVYDERSAWWVYYAPTPTVNATELIDALYDMIVKLKENMTDFAD